MPHVLLAPVTGIVLLLVLAAAAKGGSDRELICGGRRALFGMACFAPIGILATIGDWLHLYWSCTHTMLALFSVSGFLLVHVWPADRKQLQVDPARRNGATLALVGLLAIGACPLLFYGIFGEGRFPGRLSAKGMSAVASLVQAARYGFGGDIPDLMIPENAPQIARNLGHPPRWVTSPMGVSLNAALFWIQFATLALVLRVIPSSPWRRVPMLLLPLPVSMFVFRYLGMKSVESGIWDNEPWIVRLYGPVLLVALALTVVLFVAIQIDQRVASAMDRRQEPEVGS
ncbi:MAG: hypothetical protein ACI8QC_002316 [Planctomycetota bacterium]|jgi:hypothetical protein